jgi:L,D-transpeptidase YcbB
MLIRTIWLTLCCALLVSFAAPGCREDCAILAKAADGQTMPGNSSFQRLTAEGQAALRESINDAQLPGMVHPRFTDYQVEVREFYEQSGDALPWLQGVKPTPQARGVVRLFQNADSQGLNSQDYDGPLWEMRLAALERTGRVSDADLIRFDLALTVSAMRYISDLHRGRINPRLFHFDLDFGKRDIDLSEFLRNLVHAEDIDAVMATVEPPFPTYHRTLMALRTYMDLSRRDDGEILPSSPKAIRPGDSYSGVPRLIRFLTLLGDLAQSGSSSASIYEGTLIDAVKHFQQRHGLEPDGIIGAQTLRELNTPLSQRVSQLQLTLERWRWAPHEFKRPPIVVNIPEFRLRAVNEKYEWSHSMKVVVGRAYRHETPVFASDLKSVIFRPYWNVPLAIQRKELLPEIKRDPTYLANHSYEIVERNGTVVNATIPLSNELEEQLRSGKLALRQTPGPDNSLGLVKFDLPNIYDVYMHGTPAAELFSRSRRDFSHGCIRVEDPVELALWVLRDNPEWNEERIRAAMAGDQTVRVEVANPIPVLIVYGTAVVMEDGEVRFFSDIYGLDAELQRSLSKGYPYSATANKPQPSPSSTATNVGQVRHRRGRIEIGDSSQLRHDEEQERRRAVEM